MSRETILREFRTARFRVTLSWDFDCCPDYSWCDGDTLESIKGGELASYDFAVRVYLDGHEIAADYLGNSIYSNPADFAREHVGIKRKSPGCVCYFSDMIRNAIRDARDYIPDNPFPVMRNTMNR